MTDHDIDLSAALSRLRTDVRRTVAPPAATQLRHRADRRLRTRRTATALVAAALVGAVLIGGGVLWSGAAPKPPPVPGGSATPTATPSAAPSGTPSAAPRPSKQVAARNAPQVPAIWAGVDWKTATVTFPAHRDCPSGPVTFRSRPDDTEFATGPTTYPRAAIRLGTVVYGDVTGDRQPEAILAASCQFGEEDSGDGQGQILVVRRDGTTLRAIAWVGPRGGLYDDRWLDAGRLIMDVKPWHRDWGYRLGAALAYRWNGQAFTEVDSGHPGLLPRDGTPAPVIDLGPIASLTSCPATTLQFGADGTTTAAGTTWNLHQPASLPHIVDLDGDGRRRLLVAITCGQDRTFLTVLDPRSDGSFRALDAIDATVAPDGTRMSGWEHLNGTLTLKFSPPIGTEQELRFTWNGEYFQR